MVSGTGQGPGGEVTLRFWAAAKEAAGAAQLSCPAGTLAAALTGSVERTGTRGRELARVLARCSYLVDGTPVGTREPATVVLTPGSVVDVLPPFAGG